MKRLVIAAIAAAGSLAAVSASAQTLSDYDIYSQNSVSLSGPGPYGAIAGSSIVGSPGSYSSFAQSNASLTASAAAFSTMLNNLPNTGIFTLVAASAPSPASRAEPRCSTSPAPSSTASTSSSFRDPDRPRSSTSAARRSCRA